MTSDTDNYKSCFLTYDSQCLHFSDVWVDDRYTDTPKEQKEGEGGRGEGKKEGGRKKGKEGEQKVERSGGKGGGGEKEKRQKEQIRQERLRMIINFTLKNLKKNKKSVID